MSQTDRASMMRYASSSTDESYIYVQTLRDFYRQHRGLPDDARIIEEHFTATMHRTELVIIVCLKIAVGFSRPWWVNWSFVRLLGPLSAL